MARISRGGLRLAGIALAVFPSLVGCGAGTSPVTGQVTLSGRPVGPGTVIFLPKGVDEDEQVAARAVGQFGTDGKYALTTYRDGDGALPGQYRVIIQPQSAEGYGVEGAATTPSQIPLRYADPNQSGFEEAVKPGENTINFALQP